LEALAPSTVFLRRRLLQRIAHEGPNLGRDRECLIAGTKTQLSLSRPDIATMESGESVCKPDDDAGFIKLNALRLRVKARVGKRARRKA